MVKNFRTPQRSDSKLDYTTYKAVVEIAERVANTVVRKKGKFNPYKYRAVKITNVFESGGDELHEGKEQEWSQENYEWQTPSNATTWGEDLGDDYQSFHEANGGKGNIDDIVFVYSFLDENNKTQWFYRQGGGGGGGLKVARISSDNGDGTYDAVEQKWDGTQWVDNTEGLSWDGNSDTEPPIYEIDGISGLQIDRIVRPSIYYNPDGSSGWVFSAKTPYLETGVAFLSDATVQSDLTVTGQVTTSNGETFTGQTIDVEGVPSGYQFHTNAAYFVWYRPSSGHWWAVADHDTIIGKADIGGKSVSASKTVTADVVTNEGQTFTSQTVHLLGVDADIGLPGTLIVNVWRNGNAEWVADIARLERNGTVDVSGLTVGSDGTVTATVVDSWGNSLSSQTVYVEGVPTGFTFPQYASGSGAKHSTFFHNGYWKIMVYDLSDRIGYIDVAGKTISSSGSVSGTVSLMNGRTLTGQTVNLDGVPGRAFPSDCTFRVMVMKVGGSGTGPLIWYATAYQPYKYGWAQLGGKTISGGAVTADINLPDGTNYISDATINIDGPDGYQFPTNYQKLVLGFSTGSGVDNSSFYWIGDAVQDIQDQIESLSDYDETKNQILGHNSGTASLQTIEEYLKNLSSYDSTKNQVIVNNNGTIKFVGINEFTCPS